MCPFGAHFGLWRRVQTVVAAFGATLLAAAINALSSRNTFRGCERRCLSRLSESNRRPIHYEALPRAS